jgi:DNA-binding CsgD family transcriptional regulator
MDEGAGGGMRLLLIALLVAIVVGGAIDLALDRPTRWTSGHLIYESLLILGALAAAAGLWLGWRRAARSAAELRRALDERRAERDEWHERARQALAGLGEALDAQFRSWELTPAEREIALLLLKGHGHKQIAQATGRSERTVRQHATAVYQKARLGGRAELAAYFLDDLMLPPDAREVVRPKAGGVAS